MKYLRAHDDDRQIRPQLFIFGSIEGIHPHDDIGNDEITPPTEPIAQRCRVPCGIRSPRATMPDEDSPDGCIIISNEDITATIKLYLPAAEPVHTREFGGLRVSPHPENPRMASDFS